MSHLLKMAHEQFVDLHRKNIVIFQFSKCLPRVPTGFFSQVCLVHGTRIIDCLYLIYQESCSHTIIHTTSSTAQGGGGSFKNRKPIGEIGCCESGMAERSH